MASPAQISIHGSRRRKCLVIASTPSLTSGASVLGALVDGLEVRGREGARALPSVDLGIALVAEEERVAVVRSQDDELFRLRAAVLDLAGVTALEMIRSYAEQTGAAQIREDQAGATVAVSHESEIEHVSAIARHAHCLRKYDAVSLAGSHVVYQDRSRGSVGYVDEDAAVRTVIGHDVLQSGRGARQAGQVNGLHDLEKKHNSLTLPVFTFRATTFGEHLRSG